MFKTIFMTLLQKIPKCISKLSFEALTESKLGAVVNLIETVSTSTRF